MDSYLKIMDLGSDAEGSFGFLEVPVVSEVGWTQEPGNQWLDSVDNYVL